MQSCNFHWSVIFLPLTDHLDLADVGRAQRVCRAWKNIFSNPNAMLWQHLLHRYYPSLKKKEVPNTRQVLRVNIEADRRFLRGELVWKYAKVGGCDTGMFFLAQQLVILEQAASQTRLKLFAVPSGRKLTTIETGGMYPRLKGCLVGEVPYCIGQRAAPGTIGKSFGHEVAIWNLSTREKVLCLPSEVSRQPTLPPGSNISICCYALLEDKRGPFLAVPQPRASLLESASRR